MSMKVGVLAASTMFALCCITTTAVADPLVVAGMTLDAAFTIERCKEDIVINTDNLTSPCWSPLSVSDKNNPRHRNVNWPGPSYRNQHSILQYTVVVVENGILTAILFTTNGNEADQTSYIEQLKEKFGEPTSTMFKKVETVRGIINSAHVIWDTEFYVDYIGVTDPEHPTGNVYICSAATHKRDIEERAKRDAKLPPKPKL